MKSLEILFWILFFIVFYTYLGYGILLFIIVKIRRLFGLGREKEILTGFEPDVTLFVTAYNEKDYVHAKVKNSHELDYPPEKLHLVWVTDGSDDGTPEILGEYPDVTVYHINERHGKIGAMNRGMKFVDTPVVIFSDANSMLGSESVKRIIRLFNDPKVGCVSGEKRILSREKDTAAGSGEGLYWKYESTLKKLDAELCSVVGAAGELFAIRTKLYREVERDTILDDFVISLRIAEEGYTIQYDPEAYAVETSSANVKEELKRKIRISAGGIQSVLRLKPLLNIFRYGWLSFQFISHRVLRWTLTPFCLFLMIPVTLVLAVKEGITGSGLYNVLFWLQILFYLAALLGWYLENRLVRIKVLFVPYYFFIMNMSVLLGMLRYARKDQSVNWERAKRGA